MKIIDEGTDYWREVREIIIVSELESIKMGVSVKGRQ